MIVVKNQDDVALMEENQSIEAGMAQHLMKFFDDLQEELDFLSPNTYKVEDSGQAVILEAGDNVRDLPNIGLYRDQGLLGCIPEWFEIITLDQVDYYRFLVLYNDAFGVIFYSAVASHDAEVEGWLKTRLSDN